MGWAVGFDSTWNRDIGYGVPATCDFPGCGEAIDRGLSYVCGGQPYGGERGCGLYFCGDHLPWYRKDGDRHVPVCSRCNKNRAPYSPTPDTREWIEWKLADESWAAWRDENPEAVRAMKATISGQAGDAITKEVRPMLPTLTPEQRAEALRKAAEARQVRSAALAELKNGTVTLADFLVTDDEVLKRTKVKQAVQALPGVGKVRAARLMEQARIPDTRRVGGLGSVQRAALTDLLAS